MSSANQVFLCSASRPIRFFHIGSSAKQMFLSPHPQPIRWFHHWAGVQSGFSSCEFSQSHVFGIYLPFSQILWCWEFSQSRVSSMEIQPLEFHESGNWGNQTFPRSNFCPIRFDKGEKFESIAHFSEFVIIKITLGKDCLKKRVIVYKNWPKVSDIRESKSTNHLLIFIKF